METVDYKEAEKHKVCSACKINKPHSDYHRNTKHGKPTVQARCKPCMAVYKKERYWSNHEVELGKMTKSRLKPENVVQRKGYYQKNKEGYIERHKKYQADETKKARKLKKSQELYLKNRDKIRERHKRTAEKPESKEKVRLRHHERKETDIVYLIKRRLRFRLRNIIKDLGRNSYKKRPVMDLLGCDIVFFKKHIEDQFNDGMSWDRIKEIHIDHKKPCSKFDLTDIEEQKKCFHYTNLQPLWAVDNMSKGSFYQEQKTA